METSCSGCGVALAQSDVLYSADAKPVCAACNSKADLIDTDRRAAGNIVKAGWTALATGILSSVGQIALIGVIAYIVAASAMISGAYALKSLASGEERFTKHLSVAQRATARLTAIIGLVFAVATVLGIPFQMFYGAVR